MISKPLRILAMVLTAIILISFGLFAVDEIRGGSEGQQEKIRDSRIGGERRDRRADEPKTVSPRDAAERRRENDHGAVREFIDDADDLILSPFAGFVDSGSIWVQRLVPGGIGLLLYGLLLTILAGFLPRKL